MCFFAHTVYVCVCVCACVLQVKRIKDPTCGLQSGDRVLMVDGEGLCVCVCARARRMCSL
jgi:hypothetical protein